MFPYATLVALIAGAAFVHADPTPSAPGPGDVFREGGQCTFAWDVDTTGTWKEMNVELMTGDNWNMVHLTTVATLDGTDAATTTFSYACPEVTPNAAIYFYQFTANGAANRTWTTRFAIGNNDGNVTPAPNTTQPDGQAIPWGVGALVDPSTAVAAPSYLTTGATSAAGSATGAIAATSNTAAATTAAGTASLTTSKASPSATAASSSGTPSAAGATVNGTSTNSTGTNAAVSALAVDGQFFRAAVALGAAAFTFAAVL
ncbi:hypothetical protein TRAPUB_6063 [Trametes pubescens]|uniref:Yeast cell wall synthesis Kre9/Knh1-like N-terminal domain-containing protein n=1 Tax=Trametes pubescens TaxID=154538 RepID=A0A1M2V6T3_TRAPU|nr:hypothetical protein TRAPUB_6063 [Trametes pubescens]